MQEKTGRIQQVLKSTGQEAIVNQCRQHCVYEDECRDQSSFQHPRQPFRRSQQLYIPRSITSTSWNTRGHQIKNRKSQARLHHTKAYLQPKERLSAHITQALPLLCALHITDQRHRDKNTRREAECPCEYMVATDPPNPIARDNLHQGLMEKNKAIPITVTVISGNRDGLEALSVSLPKLLFAMPSLESA